MTAQPGGGVETESQARGGLDEVAIDPGSTSSSRTATTTRHRELDSGRVVRLPREGARRNGGDAVRICAIALAALLMHGCGAPRIRAEDPCPRCGYWVATLTEDSNPDSVLVNAGPWEFYFDGEAFVEAVTVESGRIEDALESDASAIYCRRPTHWVDGNLVTPSMWWDEFPGLRWVTDHFEAAMDGAVFVYSRCSSGDGECEERETQYARGAQDCEGQLSWEEAVVRRSAARGPH